MSLYKWLWSKIGGRPWTYIIRDFYHEYEWFFIAGFVLLGAVLRCYYSLKTIAIGLGVFTIGYIFGHLFWGSKWVEGQRED